MNETITEQLDLPDLTEPTIYEQLYRYLYDYHFGRITFLALLDKWKEVLHLPVVQQPPHEQQENS